MLKPSVVEQQLKLLREIEPHQREAAARYAAKARNAAFETQKETTVRPVFIADILVGMLGYAPIGSEASYTLAHEYAIRGGAVDVALGNFPAADGLVARSS